MPHSAGPFLHICNTYLPTLDAVEARFDDVRATSAGKRRPHPAEFSRFLPSHFPDELDRCVAYRFPHRTHDHSCAANHFDAIFVEILNTGGCHRIIEWNDFDQPGMIRLQRTLRKVIVMRTHIGMASAQILPAVAAARNNSKHGAH